METFDLAVIGAGPGGYVAAIRAAQLGLKVALVEKNDMLGGTCLTVGCIPSKAMLESSELFALARDRLSVHGIGVEGLKLDLGTMMRRKEEVVRQLTDGIALLMKKNKIEVVHGIAKLSAADKIEIETAEGAVEVKASTVLLATGSRPIQLPGIPFDGTHVVTSTEALSFGAVPSRMVVVGAGAVGLELGSVWSRLGAEVTVVEMLPRIVPFADTQMSKMLQRYLKAQGLQFRLNTVVTAAKVEGGKVKAVLKGKGDDQEELECDRLLVAVGRRPATGGLGLEQIGVELDDGGRVKVDDGFATTVSGVYAVGDLIRGPMLAHKASEEGVALAERLAGKPGHLNYDAIPNVVYTAPELAQVGLSEDQVKDRGIDYRVGRYYFKANGRAKSMAEEDGLAKVLAEKKTDKILGIHILGPRASELIAEAVTAVEFGGSSEDLARMCHAHPTLSETLKEAALAVDKRAIHG